LSYQQIVTVNISLDVAGVSRATFGTPIFITDHVWFKEQTRSYVSLLGGQDDFPTDSDAYAALLGAFSQDIDPATVKIGRREVDTITFTPVAATAAGQTYTIEVLDTADATTTATFVTSTGSETATVIATALATALGSPTGVTVNDDLGSVSIIKAGTAPYAVTDVARLTYVTVTTQSASDMMVAITDEDNEFYFVACNDHTSAFVDALSLDVESRTKQYWVSTQNQLDLGVYSESATDIPSILKQNARFRTSYWFHHEADTKFAEMYYLAMFAPQDAGKYVISGNLTKGIGAAKNPLTGNYLSTTDKTNLVNKNASFTENVGGIGITRRGTVSGSATFFVDIIRDRDFLEARLTENLQNLIINQKKIIYTDAGISLIENVIASTLDRYKSKGATPHILQEDNAYVIDLPERVDVSFGDVAARTISGEVTMYLAGAIQIIAALNGSLTYEAQS
jgi:hypothetical protein